MYKYGNFEWNLTKEIENINKHNLSFLESIESFLDPDGFVLEDIKHSDIEKRYYWIGRDNKKRILTTRFTQRNYKIRIIGCAEWRKFRKIYYETTKKRRSKI